MTRPIQSDTFMEDRYPILARTSCSVEGMIRIAGLALVISLATLTGCSDRVDQPRGSTAAKDPIAERREERFELLTHCGLSLPLEYRDRFWLPVDRHLRRTYNPPDGFGGDENYDIGTMRVVDDDTIVYTSSEGAEVEYEPTKRRPGGCE